MKHVLLITMGYPSIYSPIRGIFFKDQAEALVSSGMKVGLLALNPISLSDTIQKKKMDFGTRTLNCMGVKTIVYQFQNVPKWYNYRVLKSKNKGFSLFEKYMSEHGKPDILHIHTYQLGPLALKIKRKYNIPFVVTEHSSSFQDGLIPADMEKLAKLAFSESAKNISVSQTTASFLAQHYKTAFEVVPNVVNTDEFTLSSTNKTAGKIFTFLNVGSLVKEKNQQLLLEAFSIVSQKVENIQLKIVGDGILSTQLTKLATELKIEDKVHFLGLLNREKVISEMQQSNGFVLSSQIETFGVVVIEALSCGLPVVSTMSGGPDSILTQDYLGKLCNTSPEELAEAMEYVVLNSNNFEPQKIRDYAVLNYSGKAVGSKLITLYQNAIANFKQNPLCAE